MATASPVKTPTAPTEWLTATRKSWKQYWSSDVARAGDDNTEALARRLFALRDEQARMLDLARDTPFVTGSTGQTVVNPAATHALKLETAIVALEDRLGLSPKAKANLGIAVGQAQLTVEHLTELARQRAIETATSDEGDEFEPYTGDA